MSFGQFCNVCNILIRNMHVCMKPLFAPNIVLVSDEGGGLPGRQWSGLPSSQDAADYLLSGFTDCYRFTVGLNKHHQGVKTFGERRFSNFPALFAVNCPIIQSGKSGVVGTSVVTMGLINGRGGEWWNGETIVKTKTTTKEWPVWNKGIRPQAEKI